MKFFTKDIPVLLLVLVALFCIKTAEGQSILNPADSVYTYNANAAAGTVTNPNQPAGGTIGKWVRTVRMSWNTNEWKCYIYDGMCFRLHFPLTYNPTANDGKVYPMLIFLHGEGEAGAITDNEESLAHGGQTPFTTASDAGTYNGYIMVPQNTIGEWSPQQITMIKQITDYMITNNKLDPFHIGVNGLSAGGDGGWLFQFTYPQVDDAFLPMSSNDQGNGSPSNLALTKFTPIWDMQGALDTWPDINDAGIEDQSEVAAGADYTYTIFSTLGHDTWDSTWLEPNFWPFFNNAYSSNPWALHGQTSFCPGVTFSDTLGVAPGFDAYQWENGTTIIPGATSNSIVVTTLGTYSARVERNGIWSSWSPTPVVISIRQPTVTPPIAVNGLESSVIPSLSSTSVTLKVPTGYASYVWQKVGSSTTVGTTNTLNVTSPGQYIVEVTQTGGCSSSFSSPFTVASATGPNPPDPASGVLATALSQTSVLLTWNRNPSPAHLETGYEIYQGTKSGGPYTLVAIAGQDSTKDTIPNLTSGTTYYYVIRAVDSTGAATTSNEAKVVTSADTQPPTAPGAVTITGSTLSSVSLSWTASTDNVGVVAYDIYINGVKSYTVAPTQLSFTAYSLSNGPTYDFVVKARDAAGNVSNPSNQVSGEALLNGMPYNYYNGLSTSLADLPNYSTMTPAFSGSQANISLAPEQNGTYFGFLFQGYIIIPTTGTYTFQTTSDDGSALYLGSRGGLASPYVFGATPLVNNDGGHAATSVNSAAVTLTAGIYPIAVAYMQLSGGYSLTVSWETPGSTTFVPIPNSAFAQTPVVNGTAPAYPTNLAAKSLSYKSIGLTWTDNSNNETGFEIYRSTTPNGTPAIVSTVPANTTAFTDSTCQPSTTYYYWVQAINAYGGSGYDPALISGVTYSYYEFTGTWENSVLLNSMTPLFTGTLPNFSLSPATVSTDFAFKFMGYITIPTTGSYTFYTSSDDGSNLYIGGYDSAHLVVENDYPHGTTQASGTVSLTAGRVPIYVTYFQDGGGYNLTVSYKGPGISMQTIPNSALAGTGNDSAKTAAAPSVPTAPTHLTAAAVSSSTVSLGWQDTATNVSNFQVYRSGTNDHSYVLIATLSPTTYTFKDSSLFEDAKYYYKVDAVNAGGSSAFTPEDSVTTLDIPPVITAIANQQARYGTTTTIGVSATLANGGTVTLSAPGLPSFGSLTDNGNGTGQLTLNPTVSNAGTYNLMVVATDTYGGSDTTKFMLSVNNNYAPTLDSIANYSVSDGDTLSIPLTGQDVNTADTLTLSIVNPSQYINYKITQGVNGTGTLVLMPGYAAGGTYSVPVTITDNNGLTATRTFTLTVVKVSPVTTVYTRVQYQVAAPAPWNNLTGTVTNNLLDQNGNVTPIGITFNPTSWWMPYNGGPVTGNNSGVYPDAVLQEYYYFGFFNGPANPTIVVSGLNVNKQYDFTFFASSVLAGIGDNGVTSYTIGNQTVQLEVQDNLHNTVSIDTVTPAANGTVTITLGKVTSYPPGYLNALVFSNHFNDGTAPATPAGLQAAVISHGVGLTWTDVAYNENSYQVYRSQGDTLHYSLLASLPANTSSYSDTVLTGNTLYYYKVNATNTVGSSGYSNQVSITSPDRVPVISAIANVTIYNTQTGQATITAVDDSTDHLTLTASGLPSFATLTDNGNGTGVINIDPTVGLQGTYPVTVTATDMADSSRSTSFTINIVDSSLSYVYVNMTTPDHQAPLPWNNLTVGYIPYAGTAYTNLQSQTGVATGITVTLTDAWTGVAETGMKRRNGSDLYPETVSGSSFYATDNNNRRITVTGLNPELGYNFQFFISHNTSQSSLTDFTINGQTVSLNGSQNSNKTAQINGVTPDATGTVVINCQKDPGAVFALLSSLVIESYTPGSNTPFSPADLRKQDYSKTGTVSLQWQDRANNETGYEVWRAPHGGTYSKLVSLAANSTTYVDSSLPSNAAYDYIVRAVNDTLYSAYSNSVEGYTYASTVFVFPNRIWAPPYNFPTAPFPWNNLNWVYQSLGTVWNNFTDETGLPTNVGMVQPVEWDEVDPFGASTGNNSGVFPDAAMDQGWLDFVGDSSYVTFTGLDAAMSYDITMFASCTDDQTGNASGVYYINGNAGILNGHLNTTGTLTFFGITPDGNGNISIGVKAYDSSNASFAILGTVVIKGHTPSIGGNSPAPGTMTSQQQAGLAVMTAALNLPSTATDSTGLKALTAYPNPFSSYFNLSVPASMGDDILVTVTDVTGRKVYEQEFENLYTGNNILLIQPNQSLGRGVYFVTVDYVKEGQQKQIKMIKE